MEAPRCDISDTGWLHTEPLVGRQQPATTKFGVRGLWLANQLCDLVQVRTGATGTTVRLHVTGETVCESRCVNVHIGQLA